MGIQIWANEGYTKYSKSFVYCKGVLFIWKEYFRENEWKS